MFNFCVIQKNNLSKKFLKFLRLTKTFWRAMSWFIHSHWSSVFFFWRNTINHFIWVASQGAEYLLLLMKLLQESERIRKRLCSLVDDRRNSSVGILNNNNVKSFIWIFLVHKHSKFLNVVLIFITKHQRCSCSRYSNRPGRCDRRIYRAAGFVFAPSEFAVGLQQLAVAFATSSFGLKRLFLSKNACFGLEYCATMQRMDKECLQETVLEQTFLFSNNFLKFSFHHKTVKFEHNYPWTYYPSFTCINHYVFTDYTKVMLSKVFFVAILNMKDILKDKVKF